MRHAWIDVAKGFCIIFIVLGHVVNSAMLGTTDKSVWLELIRGFAPLRIPLFLFVSGYLARSSMDRPLSASFAKTGGLYLIYVIWEFGFSVLQSASGMMRGGEQPALSAWAAETTLSLLLPSTFWYIWALPAYYLLAWSLRRILGDKAPLAFVPLGLIALATPIFVALHSEGWRTPWSEITIAPVMANIIWFYAGLYCHALWHALLKRATPLTFALSVMLYLTTYLTFRIANADMFAQVALAPLALVMATQCLGSANLGSHVAQTLSKVGRLTLPVYVMHLFLLSVLTMIANMQAVKALSQSAPLLFGLVVPIIATVVLVVACRRVGMMILASPFHALLQPTRWPFAKPSAPALQEHA